MPFGQPLRDRCNIILRVCTDRIPTSTKSKLRATLQSSAGNTPPYLSPTRPRSPPEYLPPLPASSSILGDFLTEFLDDEPSAGPRQFIPYLDMFSPPSPSAHTLPPGRWTHAIRVLPASEVHPTGTTHVTDAPSSQGTYTLDLYTGPRARGVLPLTRRQLLVARDFLALALPYYGAANPPASPASSDSSLGADFDDLAPPPPQACRADVVRVLLLGPARALLAMAVAYIAHASGCTAGHVMRCIVDEAEDPEWCAVLGPDARMGLRDKALHALEIVATKEL
ncbi:hypothetical protein B0H15DRAFT_947190 [Mycena belliarum]|uniref:Uncharacterized protein n=1 Tax=Mycena belliarum TaxID=1033014 RepID=A0AAD6UAP7_9AGAR|nr:hypothetical protein B0H15DRAFT_947190 [Mycena belliae]